MLLNICHTIVHISNLLKIISLAIQTKKEVTRHFLGIANHVAGNCEKFPGAYPNNLLHGKWFIRWEYVLIKLSNKRSNSTIRWETLVNNIINLKNFLHFDQETF